MKHIAENDELLVRYLLGELGEEDQESVEERYINDPAFYEQLLAVEDDLIDSYAEGGLSQKQRASFENHFLRSPERQKRVEFAEAWMTYVSHKPAVAEAPSEIKKTALLDFLRPAVWPLAMRAAAIVLVLAGAGWLTVEVLRLKGQVEQSESQSIALQRENHDLEQQLDAERNRSQELTVQLEKEKLQTPDQPNQVSSDIVSFFLSPGLVRGGSGAKRNVIPNSARQVNLQLSLNDEQYEGYDVTITTVEGREIWRKDAAKPQSKNSGKSISVRVPAASLATNDYIVNVIGTDSSDRVARYAFSVVRK